MDDIAELLTDYTQFLHRYCYLDADYCMKAPSPVLEFLNKNYKQIRKYIAKEERQKHCAIGKNKTLPSILLDDNGNPTKEWLKFVKNYKPDDNLPILKFVETVLPRGWWASDWGIKIYEENGKHKLELHTGGWSGNEEVIKALISNIWLISFPMRYVKWETGGHYYFEICKEGDTK